MPDTSPRSAISTAVWGDVGPLSEPESPSLASGEADLLHEARVVVHKVLGCAGEGDHGTPFPANVPAVLDR